MLIGYLFYLFPTFSQQSVFCGEDHLHSGGVGSSSSSVDGDESSPYLVHENGKVIQTIVVFFSTTDCSCLHNCVEHFHFQAHGCFVINDHVVQANVARDAGVRNNCGLVINFLKVVKNLEYHG